MTSRYDDGSAGDANYGVISKGYAQYRQPDSRIATFIGVALGDARTVLNVGAGTGSYEPTNRLVTAVEPSESMRAQRPKHLSAAIDAAAEQLPFADNSFDASMATFTVHQWKNLQAGLAELRRVTKEAVLILTCDPEELDRFWLNEYAPEAIAVEARRYPPIDVIVRALGPRTQILPVPIALACTDGFGEAYYGRPEKLLDRAARLACSAWSFVDATAVGRFEAKLRHDLESGAWDSKFGHLRTQPEYRGSLQLIVGRR